MKKIRVAYIMTACKKSGPVQQMLNIIANLDRNQYEPILITLYDEATDGSSQLDKYISKGVEYYHCPLNKQSILLGKTRALKTLIQNLKIDVIHSAGVFPDFAVTKMKTGRQIHTLRNFMWDDYPVKFGKLLGGIMSRITLYTIKKAEKTVVCSKSLSDAYYKKIGLRIDCVCNGVDIDCYAKAAEGAKTRLRNELKLPQDKTILVYTGQVIDRKNQRFLLEVFTKVYPADSEMYLLILGDGADLACLKADYGTIANVDFRGNVLNVKDYLKASDLYISTSKSEGMPNSVLEAMATGLPVILSDIPQHKEIFDVEAGIGELYRQRDAADLKSKLQRIAYMDLLKLGGTAYQSAHQYFNASIMSQKYQELYKKIANR